jgi:hypothetical protein
MVYSFYAYGVASTSILWWRKDSVSMVSRDIDTNINHAKHLVGRLFRSRSKLVGVGFAGAVALISLAGAYAIYGNTTGKSFETNTTNSYRPNDDQEQAANSSEDQGGQSMEQEQSANNPDTGSTSTQGSSNSRSTTSVTVNGQRVDVPANGSYSQTIDDGNSHSEIHSQSTHTSTTNGSNTSNSNYSSVNINISSGSSSTAQ